MVRHGEPIRPLGQHQGPLIGEGGEARVYALDEHRILRRWKVGSPDEHVTRLLDILAAAGLPFATPEILDVGCDDGGWFSIERRLPGRPLLDVLRAVTGEPRRRALRSYAVAAVALRAVVFPGHEFGPLFDQAAQQPTWPIALRTLLRAAAERCRMTVERQVPTLSDVLADCERLSDDVADLTAPAFVHGDFFPGNVLVSPEGAVSSLIDIGPLTALAGDPRVDHVGATEFLTIRAHQPNDPVVVRAAIASELGETINSQAADLYRLYHALRFAPLAPPTSPMQIWCLRNLQAPRLRRDRIGSR
jgi:aminoglycoside phosphotransferase (APT) family kinase protein